MVTKVTFILVSFGFWLDLVLITYCPLIYVMPTLSFDTLKHTYTPSLKQLCVARIVTSDHVPLKIMLCELLGTVGHYNAALLLRVCQEQQNAKEFTETLFNQWLSHIPHMKEFSNAQKMTALGLAQVFVAPPELMPETLQAGLGELVTQTLQLLADIKASENRDEDEEEEDEDNVQEFEDVDEDADALGGVDTQEAIEEYRDKIQEALNSGDFDENDNPEPYASPLDDVDAFVVFAQNLQVLAQTRTSVYQAWEAGLGEEGKVRLQEAMVEAQSRAIELELMKMQGEYSKLLHAQEREAAMPRVAEFAAANGRDVAFTEKTGRVKTTYSFKWKMKGDEWEEEDEGEDDGDDDDEIEDDEDDE
jgi:hypothetical protein